MKDGVERVFWGLAADMIEEVGALDMGPEYRDLPEYRYAVKAAGVPQFDTWFFRAKNDALAAAREMATYYNVPMIRI